VITISNDSIKEIGKSLKKAAKLDTSPLSVYSSENIPDNAVPMCSNNRCVAKAILINAVDKEELPLYIGKDTRWKNRNSLKIYSNFVTYPAGMAEKAPKKIAFVGPVDPTENIWFPPEYIAIGIPRDIAKRMHEDLEDSFAAKRPEVANPKIRDTINLP